MQTSMPWCALARSAACSLYPLWGTLLPIADPLLLSLADASLPCWLLPMCHNTCPTEHKPHISLGQRVQNGSGSEVTRAGSANMAAEAGGKHALSSLWIQVERV